MISDMLTPFGVFVQFGPAGAAAEGHHAGDIFQPLFDHAGDAVGGFQRVARRQQSR